MAYPTGISQDLLKDCSREIKIRTYDLRNCAPPCLEYGEKVVELGTSIGISILQDQEGGLEYFALSDGVSVSVMSLYRLNKKSPDCPKALTTLLEKGVCVAFDMSRVALHVWATISAHVRGYDLSRIGAPDQLTPQAPGKVVSDRVGFLHDKYPINSLWNNVCGPPDYNGSHARFDSMCLRAWLSARTALSCRQLICVSKSLDTRTTKSDLLRLLQRHVTELDVINGAKPVESHSQFTELSNENGKVDLTNARFKTRVRASQLTRIIATYEDGTEHYGSAKRAVGRKTHIKLESGSSKAVKEIRIVGREELTNTERERDNILMQMLRGDKNPWMLLFVRLLWLPKVQDRERLDIGLEEDAVLGSKPSVPLNASQEEVVTAMMSKRPIVIAHGPPGTGKTSTMAAATELWQQAKKPVYIVAHSNVAVKNIAEKLYKCNIDFKLFVSRDFYVEWHEHMYIFMKDRVIRTDELPRHSDKLATERSLEGSNVILSTSSTLCNPTLHNNHLFTVVPMERLIVDEASQINVFDYLPVLDKFSSLEKICFFGDPKQLPPFGKVQAPTLQSVFEVGHLQDVAGCTYFLDTQYRMPVFIGQFLSRSVYGGRLQSNHDIYGHDCVAFVDEASGIETKSGFSWTNEEEVKTIIALVKTHYKNKAFAIITPYDAQRAAIESALKQEDLPWEDIVFNVDSFQGNERDFILISLVRTRLPGFLASEQRMNVMLSRSKKGLIVVSNKVFLSGPGCNTLVGMLARHWEQQSQSKIWLSRKEILSYDVTLPGFDAKLSPAASNNLRYIPKPSIIRSVHMYTPTEEEKSVQPDARQFPQFGNSGTKVAVSAEENANARLWAEVVRLAAPAPASRTAAPERKKAAPLNDWRDEYESLLLPEGQTWETLAAEFGVDSSFIPAFLQRLFNRPAVPVPHVSSSRHSFRRPPPSPTDFDYSWPVNRPDAQSWTSDESQYNFTPMPPSSQRASLDMTDEKSFPTLPTYAPISYTQSKTPQPFIRTLKARIIDDSARVPKVQKKPKKAAAEPAPNPTPPASQSVYDPVWPSPEDAGLVNLGGFKVKPTKKTKTSPAVTAKVVVKPTPGKKMKMTFIPNGDKRQAKSYEWHSKTIV